MDAQQVSRLSARWVEELPEEGSTVLSGAGVWPLLAILAELADGPAREELAEAAGGRYTGLLQAAGVRMALGLWTRPEVLLEPDVDKLVPPDCRGVLSGQEDLDQWVKDQTNGLLDRIPIEVNENILLVLASALAVKTQWALPFTSSPRGDREWLSRWDYDLESLARYETPAGPLTIVTVHGRDEIDVQLVLAEPQRSRAGVLTAALACLAASPGSAGPWPGLAHRPGTAPGIGEAPGRNEPVRGGQLLRAVGEVVSPGVQVVESMSPIPTVGLSMPAFEVVAEHDLLATAAVFGLQTARDASRGHFPGLSARPLAVNQAKQAVLARFSATGFEAAAVTAIAMEAGAAPARGGRALLVTLDRPFGFVAVHRPTGIPLVTGWFAG